MSQFIESIKIENGKLIFENIDFNYEESINFDYVIDDYGWLCWK